MIHGIPISLATIAAWLSTPPWFVIMPLIWLLEKDCTAFGEMLSSALSSTAGTAAIHFERGARDGDFFSSFLEGAFRSTDAYLQHRRFRFGPPRRWNEELCRWEIVE